MPTTAPCPRMLHHVPSLGGASDGRKGRSTPAFHGGVSVFATGGARPPTEIMVSFIDDQRDVCEVEPICAVLPIAPTTYFTH